MVDPLFLSQEFLQELEHFQIVVKRMATGQFKGERRSRSKGDSVDFADYRNYVIGDDLRFLDWKLFGRLERLFIRLFLQELEMPIYVLLDSSRSMDEGNPTKFDFGRKLCAVLAYLTLSQTDPFTFYTFGGQITGCWGPHRGRKRFPDFLHYLQEISPTYGETCLTRSIQELTTHAKYRGIAFILSDFFDFHGWEEALRRCLGHRMELIVVHILAPQEEDPDLDGEVELVDREFQYHVALSITRSVRECYKRSVQNFRQEIDDFVTKRGGIYIPVRSNEDLVSLVIRDMKRKGVIW